MYGGELSFWIFLVWFPEFCWSEDLWNIQDNTYDITLTKKTFILCHSITTKNREDGREGERQNKKEREGAKGGKGREGLRGETGWPFNLMQLKKKSEKSKREMERYEKMVII